MVSGSDHIDIQIIMKSKGTEMWETLFQYCEREEKHPWILGYMLIPGLVPPAAGGVMCTELRFAWGS